MKVAINGACGRMGREVLSAALARDGIQVVACWEREGHPDLGSRPAGYPVDVNRVWEGRVPDVVIDFTSEAGLHAILPGLATAGCGLVCGTTGLSEGAMLALGTAAESNPVFHATNLSTGVYVLGRVAQLAARLVGEEWDKEIVEIHHRRKADAPSGTALTLARLLQEASATELAQVRGRSGLCGPRKAGELGIHAVRAGDVVGEHEVILAGPSETLRLSHSALSRSVFAVGAVRAAVWLAGRRPGLYGMSDLFSGA